MESRKEEKKTHTVCAWFFCLSPRSFKKLNATEGVKSDFFFQNTQRTHAKRISSLIQISRAPFLLFQEITEGVEKVFKTIS